MKKIVFPESFNSPNSKTVVLWSGGVDSTGVMVNGLNVKIA